MKFPFITPEKENKNLLMSEWLKLNSWIVGFWHFSLKVVQQTEKENKIRVKLFFINIILMKTNNRKRA
jgi:hypothetical protein